MNNTEKLKFSDGIKNMGSKSIIAFLLLFLLTVAAICVGGYKLFRSTKDSIHLQGRVNAVQSAKEFDGFLLVRKNTVVLARHVVDEMIKEGRPTSDILDYLTAESSSIQMTIDKDFTGLYGWINGEYCDGVGWVPDEDYVPTERPWYLETIADDSDVTFVQPYLDEQTGMVVTTMAQELSDGESVIAMDVTLGHIQVITEEIAKQTPGSFSLVLDKTGQVIAHSDPSELGKNYLEENNTPGAALARKLILEGGKEFEFISNGKKYMAFAEDIEGGWHTVSVIDTNVFYRPLMVIMALLALFAVLEAIGFITIIYNQSAKNLALASAEEAQNANRAKTRFLSRMSHEIRTPINAIIGLDSIALRDDSISPHTRDELNKIGASARHLLAIVNDILDMSRIESGRMELKEEIFSFRDFLEEICIIAGGQCEDKGLRFICNKTEPLEEYFVGDNLKLKQVIINILGNSVKFTDSPGVITFSIRQENSADDRALLCFTMEDTGIGMDPEFIPRLFEAFSQEDTDNTSRYGGSGLGMSITKSFVEMMGGEIRVESEKGVGTTFHVSVLLGRVKEEEIPQSADEKKKEEMDAVAGLHLLIAEDQELNAEVLTDLLELEDMSSEWAENGQRAVEMFAQSEEGHFAAILMDMRMPVMDGITATREIRNLERPDAKTIPIIALTANAFEEDVKQCLQAGMDVHMSKPVDMELLKETLARLLNR